MQKLAALSSFMAVAVLTVTTITDFMKEIEKLKLKGKQMDMPVLPINQTNSNQENTIKYVDYSRPQEKAAGYYPTKTGICRICEYSGYTEWHHIISQHHARKTNQHLLLRNPGNIVELCKGCHDQTTASKSRYLYQKKVKKTNRFW